MSQTQANAAPKACPRCRSATVDVLSVSPVPGVWTLFSCPTCLYSWRSTEPDENTDADKYPPAFRLNPDALASLPVMPSIPPLRRADGD